MSRSALFQSTPEIVITRRLTLRPLKETDLDTLVSLLGDPEVGHYTARLPFPYTRIDAETFLAMTKADPFHRVYVMADRGDALLGIISVVDPQDERPPQIGYWLGKPFWGQDYTSEALDGLIKGIIEIGRIDRLGARVLVENPPSRRVLEKGGFVVIEETTSIIERHLGRPLLVMQRALP